MLDLSEQFLLLRRRVRRLSFHLRRLGLKGGLSVPAGRLMPVRAVLRIYDPLFGRVEIALLDEGELLAQRGLYNLHITVGRLLDLHFFRWLRRVERLVGVELGGLG